MGAILIRDLMGAHLFRDGDGLVMVFKAYFDDSGTHASSEVVLWAGFVGHARWWDRQERAWQAVLDREGLQHFHMAECEAGDGPYGNRAARDALTHDLRQTILDTPLTGTCVAARQAAWNNAPAKIKAMTGSAAELCATMVMDNAIVMLDRKFGASSPDVELAFYLDKGASSAQRQVIMNKILNGVHDRTDAISFVEMRKSPALQACDMVAWELLQQARFISRENALAMPRPHFKPFLNRVEFVMLDEKSIATLAEDDAIPDLSQVMAERSSS
jgi:hypothetical protein